MGGHYGPHDRKRSAVSTGFGLGSPKFMTLFLSMFDKTQKSHFWNFFLNFSKKLNCLENHSFFWKTRDFQKTYGFPKRNTNLEWKLKVFHRASCFHEAFFQEAPQDQEHKKTCKKQKRHDHGGRPSHIYIYIYIYYA